MENNKSLLESLPFPSLLKELADYTPKPLLRWKVRRIYRKCLEQGHLNWAKQIAEKYREHMHYTDDAVLAFGWALQAKIDPK